MIGYWKRKLDHAPEHLSQCLSPRDQPQQWKVYSTSIRKLIADLRELMCRFRWRNIRMNSSRSQARRVLTRFYRFEEVFLDFRGVDAIGQAFADEIFRVFAKSNPEIRLVAINTNEQVQAMINMASASSDAHDPRQKKLFEP
jgi:hypothetical protein